MSVGEPGRVTREGLDAIAMSLPEVTHDGTPEHPAYAVRGRKFVMWRGPRKDAVDPDTGERMPDVIAIVVPSAEDKQAYLACAAGRRRTTRVRW